MTNEKTNEKKKPAFKTKVGHVNATVFANDSKKGPWYSLTIDRVYKIGEEFKRTSSFPTSELDNLEVVVQRVKEWIANQSE